MKLTSRETEILRLVATGQTSKQIAEELKISNKTVESYRARLCNKLGISGAANLTRYAIKLGLVQA